MSRQNANATAEHVQPVTGVMLPECFHVTSFPPSDAEQRLRAQRLTSSSQLARTVRTSLLSGPIVFALGIPRMSATRVWKR